MADQPDFAHGEGVDFQERTGEQRADRRDRRVLTKIRRKYKEYGINEKPFVVVKADNGTYGMGVMTVRDAKELAELTKRDAQQDGGHQGRPRSARGHHPGRRATYERVNDAVAEPVVYMIDRYVVGGFYRVHAERGIDENLNAPGASFVPLAFAESSHLPEPGAKPGASAPNRFYMYGVMAGWRCWRRRSSWKRPIRRREVYVVPDFRWREPMSSDVCRIAFNDWVGVKC